jgi:molybdenum cofactor cytidylyltransferase
LLASPLGGAKARPPGAALLPIFNKADGPLRLLYGRLAAAQLAAAGQPSLLGAAGAGAPWAAEPGSAKAQALGHLAGRVAGEVADAPVLERWGQAATVILAAGAATRLGRPKQIEPVAGEPLLLRALAVAAGVGGPVYVVTGAHRAAVLALLGQLPAGLAAQLAGRLHVIDNPAWDEGQASSLHASIRALPASVEAAIWMPVDQPYLEAGLLARLVAAWRRGADLVAPLAAGELRGAPALFDRSRWPALLQVEGDSGGRAVLRRFAGETATVPVDPATLHDIDSPQDLVAGY